jgi:hypothetical protein
MMGLGVTMCNLSPSFSAVVLGALHGHKIQQNNARETGTGKSSVQLVLEHAKWNVLHPKDGTCHEKKNIWKEECTCVTSTRECVCDQNCLV